MLFLLFQSGNDRFALETGRVVEIVPLLDLQKIPHAPRGVAGLFNYHGRAVPAVDLAQMTRGQPSEERLGTRIVIVQSADGDGNRQLLGLIVEHAVEVLHKDAAECLPSGVHIGDAPFLGPVITDERGVIQWIHEQRLLSEQVRDLLFSETARLTHARD
jgi:chemotaxis-related protein WspB